MKIIIAILFLLWSVKGYSSNILLFEKANQYYHNQQYLQSAELYMQMIQEGYSSANIYYNAGNAFFKLKRAGITIWCYEKALQIDPKLKNAKDNLLVARTQLKVPQKQDEANEKRNFLYKFLNMHSVNNWALGALVFMLVYAIFFILKKWGKSKPLFIVLRKLSFMLTLIYLAMAIVSYKINYNNEYGICIENTSLQNGTTVNSKEIAKIVEGEKLKIVQRDNTYSKVIIGKQEGYIKNSTIKPL